MALMLSGVILLGACGHTPIMSITELRKIDFETTDVRKLAVAVQIPSDLVAAKKGAVLVMTISDASGKQIEQEDFLLRKQEDFQSDPILARYQKPDFTIATYELAPEDAPRFARVRNLRFAPGGEAYKGSISVNPRICRNADFETRPLRVSAFLKTSETKRFVPLLVDYDLRKELEGAEIETVFPHC
jgi:hypothetical protein